MKSIRTDTNHSCVPIPCYILIVYSVYSILILIVYKISMYFTVCTNRTFCYTSIMYQSNCDIEMPLPITQRQSKMFSKYLFFSFLKPYSNVLQLWVASPFPFYIVEEKKKCTLTTQSKSFVLNILYFVTFSVWIHMLARQFVAFAFDRKLSSDNCKCCLQIGAKLVSGECLYFFFKFNLFILFMISLYDDLNAAS